MNPEPLPTAAAFIQAARSLVGTPYVHQGRLPGPHGGLDCSGLVLSAGEALGLVYPPTPPYPRIPSAAQLSEVLRSRCEEADGPAPGRIVQMVPPRCREPIHLAILTETLGWIHAVWGLGVVEQRFPPRERWIETTFWEVKGIQPWQL